LEEWVVYDKTRGAYIAAVPFFTPVPGASFDDVETKIILPEGAKVLEYVTPFPVDTERQDTHITYLDSIGRPAILFQKNNITNEHAGLIYVIYKVDADAHLRKPLVVAASFFTLFALAMSLRRLDFSIHSPKKHV